MTFCLLTWRRKFSKNGISSYRKEFSPMGWMEGLRFYILFTSISATVKILKFGTPQTIAIIVLKITKFDVTLH